MASVLTTPYMFTQTHRVNTHLKMFKKKQKHNSNQTKSWSRNEIQAAKISYMMGKIQLRRKKQGKISEFCGLG